MKEELPLVTIKCITYNHEPYIRQCLEGFVMQKTNFKFEAIVHDDASTDKTAEIIREYAEKYPDIIKPIYETENQYSKMDGSLGRIMNEHTRGKYVALCEGDDYWIDKNKLKKQIEFLEEHQEYSMSHTGIKYFFQRGGRFVNSKDIQLNAKYNHNGNVSLSEILFGNYRIQTVSVVYRANLLQKLKLEDQFLYNSRYFMMGDIQLWFGLARLGKIHFLPEVTSIYRKNINSATMQKNFRQRMRFELSSAELRYYLSLNYPLNDNFKENATSNYKKKLVAYKRIDKNFIPKFKIDTTGVKGVNTYYFNLKYLLPLKNFVRPLYNILVNSL